MLATSGIRIGPLYFHDAWFGYIAAYFIGRYVLRWWTKASNNWGTGQGETNPQATRKFLMDAYSNAWLVWVIAWRFSGLVVSPFDALKHPVTFIFTVVPPGAWKVSLIAVVLFLFIVFRRRKFEFRVFRDAIGLALLFAAASIELFLPIYGGPTGMPWGVQIGAGRYQPVFLYNTLALMLCGIWQISRAYRQGRKGTVTVAGGVFLEMALMCLGAVLLMTSLFRIPSFLWYGLDPTQWFALSVLVVGLGMYWRRGWLRTSQA